MRPSVDVRDDGSADFQAATSAFDRLRVKARSGDDKVRVDASVTVPTGVQGQGGKDAMAFDGANVDERMELSARAPASHVTSATSSWTSTASRADAIGLTDGGAGNDILVGGPGNNVVIQD